jgi:hypothetical protein
VYSLVVSGLFEEWEGKSFRFDKRRFLEYTSDAIKVQLRPLSLEAIECLKSWPCVLIEEGRTEEVVRIGRITELRDLGGELRVTVKLCPSDSPILNDHLWRIREELDIDQFEFSRNHWAVKERDLFSVLRTAEHQCDVSSVGPFEEMPLPVPARAALISARNAISEWSHTEIDDLLLEAGVADLSAGRSLGSRRDRANAITQFAIGNPEVVTAENSLLSAYARQTSCRGPSRERNILSRGRRGLLLCFSARLSGGPSRSLAESCIRGAWAKSNRPHRSRLFLGELRVGWNRTS